MTNKSAKQIKAIRQSMIWEHKKLLIISLIVVGLAGYFYLQQKLAKAKELACQAQVAHNDLVIAEFYPKISTYSQVLSLSLSENDKSQLIAEWKAATDKIAQSSSNCLNKASIIDWQTGEMYRFGYNLDYPESWGSSENFLLQAIQEDPTFIKPYFSLATLYVNSNLSYAPNAEKLLLKAEELAITNEDKLAVYNGLFFAYYYQFDLEKAGIVVNKALEINPTDEWFIGFKKMLQSL